MKLGIVGTRKRNEKKHYILVCEKVLELGIENISEIVSGGCKQGGDRFAEIIAKELNIPIKIFRPQCETDYTKPWLWVEAAYARNQQIADYSDKLIALVSPWRSGGTENTVEKFLKNHSKEDLFIL